jgi:hypothetical protein
MYDRIAFSGWSWEKFEDFVVDLLVALGFRNVNLLGADAPGLDIVALEDRRTILGVIETVSWGVQIKSQRSKPSAFGDIQKAVAAADRLSIHEVLWVTLLDVRQATRDDVSNYIANNYSKPINVYYASERQLRRLAIEHPDILLKFFNIDHSDIASTVKTLMSPRIANNLKNFSATDLAATIATFDGERTMTDATSGDIMQMRYETRIHPFEGMDRGFGGEIFKITDRVTYLRTELSDQLKFVFTLHHPLFEESITARNEYTWKVHESVPWNAVREHIFVQEIEVNGIEVPLLEKRFVSNSLEYAYDSASVRARTQPPYFIHYVVHNCHPRTKKTIFSVLHEPALGYEFSLDVRDAGAGSISYIPFLPADGRLVSDVEGGRARLRWIGPAPARSGLVLSWL